MKSSRYIIIILLVIFSILVVTKIFIFDYTLATVLPESGYRISVEMDFSGHGEEVNIRMPLPIKNERQEIFDEIPNNGSFNYITYKKDKNRFGFWQKYSVNGKNKLSYKFNVKSKKTVYNLPETIQHYERQEKNNKYLEKTKLIQVGSSDVVELLENLNLSQNSDLIDIIKKLYNYISYDIENASFSGNTDALTTLRLGQASCNGKSRLFVAALRTLGIPSRLVGGIILKEGTKRVGHQWLEIQIGQHWIPFDPTNKHFATLPENYLVFYYGDIPFFQRSSNINFDYSYVIDKKLFPREDDYSSLASHPLNIMNAWKMFQSSGLSLELLRIILMIPIGAVVTIIIRNVIGINTFGTFLPVLIASSLRDSGLLWGGLTFISIIIIGSGLRYLLDKLRITHTPKLTVLLVFVVFSLLSVSALGVSFGNMELAKANIFPLALMAITIERFALLNEESGPKEAFKIFFNTIIAVIACYLVIHSLFLQTIVMAFPETMLLVISAGLYFGNWIGLRFTELIRFKSLVFVK